jgi:hypothetical protein
MRAAAKGTAHHRSHPRDLFPQPSPILTTPPKIRFALDSALEEAGFEPSVPLAMAGDHHHSCLPIPSARRRFSVSRVSDAVSARKKPPVLGTGSSHPSFSAGSGQLTLIGGNAFASVRVYDSASLLLERRALSRGLAEVSAISAELVPVGEGQGGGVFSKAARCPVQQRLPGGHPRKASQRHTRRAAPLQPRILRLWRPGSGCAGGIAPVFSIALSVTVNTPRF